MCKDATISISPIRILEEQHHGHGTAHRHGATAVALGNQKDLPSGGAVGEVCRRQCQAVGRCERTAACLLEQGPLPPQPLVDILRGRSVRWMNYRLKAGVLHSLRMHHARTAAAAEAGYETLCVAIDTLAPGAFNSTHGQTM